MKRKILYITGTRADYGLMRSVLYSIHHHPNLSLDLIVVGMHLMDQFGNTINEIKNDGFKYHIVDVRYEDDTKEAMAIFIGKLIQELVPLIHQIGPDFILLLGDRGEMLAGAIVGVYLSIPVAHIHGGDVTSTVDDFARNAITKLAHIHFPATEESGKRIIRFGEDASKIFVVGSPGLYQGSYNPLSREQLEEKYQIDLEKPLLLLVQHPVTLEIDAAADQILETLEAVKSLKIQTIVIYPNADAGGRAMIEAIREYEKLSFLKIFPSIPHDDYLSLMYYASVLIGNSSSALIEAPSFGLPVVNIGTRQMGRERADNVIDAIYDKKNIIDCIGKAMNDKIFREKVMLGRNPYGEGMAPEKIAEVLSKIDINKEFLMKIN